MLKTKKKITWNFHQPETLLKWQGVHTVCEESACPNRPECSQLKTATFLIGGKFCTRNCLFCRVEHGRSGPVAAVKDTEQREILAAVSGLGLKFVVITSVTRDDDPEGLARHFHDLTLALNRQDIGVELLIPDFRLDRALLDLVGSARPRVIAHNVETVERLSAKIRPQASYKKSLDLLQHYTLNFPKITVKSGFMVGLGETPAEIRQTIADLKNAGVEVLTVGQYLRPTEDQAEVVRHYSDDEFAEIRQAALEIGIRHVESGYFTRSSYKAGLYAGDM